MMKTSKFFTLAMVIAASCAAMTSCSIKDNEKAPEVVEDPIKDVVEYYINGKVTEGNAALAGVKIDVDGATATTDASGLFSVTVSEKGSYTVKASKEGYLAVNGMTASIPSNASNRASVAVNISMTKKASAVVLPKTDKAIVVTTSGATADADMSNVEKGAGAEIPAAVAAAIEEGTTVAMTEYVPEMETATSAQGTQDISTSIMNVYIETSKDIPAAGVKVAMKNPVSSSAASSFKTVDVYRSVASRAGDAYTKMGEATLNPATNSYEFTLTEGNLAGDYSFRINAKRTVSAAQEESITSGKVDNSGNFEAKKNVEIAYSAPMGWTYTQGFDSKLDANLTALMKNSINAQEGAEGTYNVKFKQTTNVSGNSIMYYNAKSTFVTVNYTFSLTNQDVKVALKKYTGSKLDYSNESADKHSGGTSK